MKKIDYFKIILYIFFVVLSLCFILPLVLVVSASFTSEQVLTGSGGFSLLPREFSMDAYVTAFANKERMIRAYIVTAFQAVVGTFASCLVCGWIAYPLSRSNFRFKGIITGIVFFTMLFGAGTIPNYIIYSKYYHITNSVWIYLLPGITGGAWNTMIFRTFFKGLPESLFESAKMDGAKEFRIFFQIIVPLSTPVFATLGFMTLVGKWNDYSTSLIYIRDDSLYTLQYLLQRLMQEASFLKGMASNAEFTLSQEMLKNFEEMPSESLKYAMCVIAAGPMLFVFPFFQKYFSKGLTVGAVKG